MLLNGRFTFTVRLRLGGSVVVTDVIEAVEVPSFETHGAVVDLRRALYEDIVQSGERLVLEVVAGVAGTRPVHPERIRFSARLAGCPSTWLGVHEPSYSEPWRLWYRVEQIEDEPRAGAAP